MYPVECNEMLTGVPNNSVRTPDFGIQITVPSESFEIHAAVLHEHAFDVKTLTLLLEGRAAGRKRDASVAAQDTMPGQFCGRSGIAQNLSDQSRTSRKSRAFGDFAIARDATARNRRHGAPNGGVLGIRAFFRLLHRLGTLA